jgi:hypothetical protein
LLWKAEQTKTGRNALKWIRGIYEKPTVSMIISFEILKDFSLKFGVRHECPILLLFSFVLGS